MPQKPSTTAVAWASSGLVQRVSTRNSSSAAADITKVFRAFSYQHPIQ